MARARVNPMPGNRARLAAVTVFGFMRPANLIALGSNLKLQRMNAGVR
jgi:hypothetical protein